MTQNSQQGNCEKGTSSNVTVNKIGVSNVPEKLWCSGCGNESNTLDLHILFRNNYGRLGNDPYAAVELTICAKPD